MQLVEEYVKIQSRGVLTIPKRMRKKLFWGEGDLVKIIVKKGRLILEPVRILPYQVRGYTDKEVRSFLKQDEKETKRLRKKGIL